MCITVQTPTPKPTRSPDVLILGTSEEMSGGAVLGGGAPCTPALLHNTCPRETVPRNCFPFTMAGFGRLVMAPTTAAAHAMLLAICACTHSDHHVKEGSQ